MIKIILVTLLTLLWPLTQLAIFYFRFNNLPQEMILESVAFAPVGFLGGIFLSFLLDKSQSRIQRILITSGFVLAIPISMVTSLMGGLLLPPPFGSTLFGLVPLTLLSGIGFGVGKLFSNPKPSEQTQ